jgi:hypothetical protein
VQLAPMRFTKIDGTSVAVDVKSADQAKAALKELRHKKRELKFLRGALAKQHKATRPKRGQKAKPDTGGLGLFLDDLRWGLSAIVGAKPEAEKDQRPLTLAEVEREMQSIDEILHNIDGCILQLQGRLLTRGR